MVMATLDQFGNNMRRRGVRVEAGVNRKVRRIALAILTEVVVQTPVDTGRARANWSVGLGGPPDSGNEEPFAPGQGGNTAAANATAAIDAGRAAMEDREPEQDIYISNNVPYIQRLNEGWSAQAPAGFIQSAVTYGVAVARGDKVVD